MAQRTAVDTLPSSRWRGSEEWRREHLPQAYPQDEKLDLDIGFRCTARTESQSAPGSPEQFHGKLNLPGGCGRAGDRPGGPRNTGRSEDYQIGGIEIGAIQ